MDFNVTQKEKVRQPKNGIEVLTSNIFDLKLKEEIIDDITYITDVEILDDEEGGVEELKDRVIFSVIRQRGQDPIAPLEGNQWSEAMLEEIPVSLLVAQCINAAAEESTAISVTFSTIRVDGTSRLSVEFTSQI